ncbi:SDR family NAD(P)-dependent oxidoreductase [Eoetvoesiella caeni]|uniref:SDR family NAD(P)-dependent oxidoreductase n=1 Tax=Eoetvoesiella caeni TaxID=645616 RepID=UPI003642E3DB
MVSPFGSWTLRHWIKPRPSSRPRKTVDRRCGGCGPPHPDRTQLQKALQQNRSQDGTIDVLVNNAGISRGQRLVKHVRRRLGPGLNRHLKIAVCACKEVFRHDRGGHGRIINI